MKQGKAARQATRQEPIDRPRLRAIVDESRARAILLVAPAGYGKTTFARQWINESNRPAAWYTCTSASADVAALALGLARTSPEMFPGAFSRLQSRLKARTSIRQDPEMLAELLTEIAPQMRDEAWLILDDYHHVMQSGPAEELIEQTIESCKIRLLIASRRRPSWASARKLLYGELDEIPRALLAMTNREATDVLQNKGAQARAVIETAGGWPAVIGLAARSESLLPPMGKLAAELYDFFAQELYEAAPTNIRRDLHRLAMVPSSTNSHIQLLFGARADSVVDELIRLGFLTSSTDRLSGSERLVDLHPLVRDFVADKIAVLPPLEVEAEAREVAELLCASAAWDDVFFIIDRFALTDLLPGLMERALEPLLEQGRTRTIERWLVISNERNLRAPALDLARAEMALRRGAWRLAVALGRHAADGFPKGHRLTSRALNCAARAAHFSDQGKLAVALHAQARAFARRPEDVRESLWGKFVSESEIDLAASARATLDQYEQLEICDGDDLLRRTTGRLVLAVRHGPLSEAVRMAPGALSALGDAQDPITRTGFLQMYVYAMALAGRYQEAHEGARAEIEAAEKYGLEFIEIHALCALAMAEIGLRRFASAEAALERARVKLRRVDDVHAEMALSTARMKIGLIRGDDALLLGETDRVWPRAPSSGMHGDLLAVRGLVYLQRGNYELARRSATAAEAITHQLVARLTAKCVRAVAAVEEQCADAETAALGAFDEARAMGAFDPFVISYRSFPSLLLTLAGTRAREQVQQLTDQVGDRDIAVQAGVSQSTLASSLSRREHEVLELIGRGLSNRAIAEALWISESTAKVHVRHIFDKLNVRTRTEAALLARERTHQVKPISPPPP